MTDPTDPVAPILGYLRELVAIPTAYPPGDTRAMAAYLAKEFEGMGYATVVHGCAAGQDNVVARMGGGEPCLVFNVHVDTVDAGDENLWNTPPLVATEVDGKVFGLGVANCKGSGAVQLWLAREIARRGGPARGEVVFSRRAYGQHGHEHGARRAVGRDHHPRQARACRSASRRRQRHSPHGACAGSPD